MLYGSPSSFLVQSQFETRCLHRNKLSLILPSYSRQLPSRNDGHLKKTVNLSWLIRHAAGERCRASDLLNLHDRTVEHWKYHNVTGRILLVESDVVLAAVLEEVLGQSGYEVVIVNTLKDEGKNIRSARAVVLDIDTTFAEKELAWLDEFQPSDESLPIILLGLQVAQEVNHRLRVDLDRRQTNVLTLLQKPFRNEELLDALQQA